MRTVDYLEVATAVTPAWVTYPVPREAIWFNQVHYLHGSILAWWATYYHDWFYYLMVRFCKLRKSSDK